MQGSRRYAARVESSPAPTEAPPPPPRRWTRALVAALLIGLLLFVRNVLGLEWGLDGLRETVEALGVWGPLVFIGLVSIRQVLLLPHMLVLVVGGLVFGTVEGTVYGAIGIWNSAMGIFLLTRWLGGETVRARISPRLRPALDRASTRGGVGMLALVNAYPFMTISVFHAAAGLTTMSVWAFAAAIALTSPVRTWTYAYFGAALMEGSPAHIAGATVVALLLLSPLLIPSVRQRIRREFALDPPAEAPR